MESRIQEALQYFEDFPGAKVAAVARLFHVPRGRLRYRLEGRQPKKGAAGHNTLLTRPEELAVCRYIDRLDNVGLAVRKEFVRDAANLILRERSSKAKAGNPPAVGQHWVSRFLTRYGYDSKKQKTLDSNRQVAEDIDKVNQYFQRLREIIETHGITPEDIWNMDETGFQLGVGKDQLIVTKRERAHYLAIPTNRESATAIEAISAAGRHCPGFLIMTGSKHMARWYAESVGLDEDTALGVSETGYSNDELSLEWIRHFDKHTASTAKGLKRLLILDGHGSHHTKEFIEYCDNHHIIPFGLPSHLTHILQPLDVCVLQPLKHYHAKALDLAVRDGCTNITKLEFLASIKDVRNHAFKRSPESRQPHNPTPEPQFPTGSSPFETPLTLRQVNKLANNIMEAVDEFPDLMASISTDIDRYVRGTLAMSTELVQTKRDLGRTKLAETVAKRRRAMKNKTLQTGGVLTVAEGRRMVQRRVDADLAAARRRVQAAEQRARNGYKRWFEATAKEARC
ncbi:DDE superfamily endonuclease domain-containing protein [Pochonia chlamydosporia 170]|uniref:DDE superfamily endonuclease domain-containing protein n=1 Tax=Pochonia chlamydosporia 170 TaxID=1380566 RepID=A0A219AP86_METCM|nr:DDE superfamily endonuclease domain-containing protein [Pochonia chlamydosporia 170]OWT42563.1 DDE superfamily endonuclease domain-containing protein [Pochonia chlamydosporia 170]